MRLGADPDDLEIVGAHFDGWPPSPRPPARSRRVIVLAVAVGVLAVAVAILGLRVTSLRAANDRLRRGAVPVVDNPCRWLSAPDVEQATGRPTLAVTPAAPIGAGARVICRYDMGEPRSLQSVLVLVADKDDPFYGLARAAASTPDPYDAYSLVVEPQGLVLVSMPGDASPDAKTATDRLAHIVARRLAAGM